jgi:hypothetical protein
LSRNSSLNGLSNGPINQGMARCKQLGFHECQLFCAAGSNSCYPRPESAHREHAWPQPALGKTPSRLIQGAGGRNSRSAPHMGGGPGSLRMGPEYVCRGRATDELSGEGDESVEE